MNTTGKASYMVASLFVLLGCSEPKTKQERASAPSTAATFVNKVWRVAESSSVAPGLLYVFLSEGTLVFASPHGKPALGTWSSDDRGLTIVEEGLPYRVDILALSATELRIRVHNPGEPVEIRLVPAEGSSPSDGS